MAIELREALGITEDSSRPFHIQYVTLDRSRKTGGKIIDLTEAVRVGASHNKMENETITVKQLGNGHHPHNVHVHLITEVNHQEVFI